MCSAFYMLKLIKYLQVSRLQTLPTYDNDSKGLLKEYKSITGMKPEGLVAK